MTVSPIALPTNRDENWRYANLRPFTKARVEATAPCNVPLMRLPAPIAGFQRWIYVNGHDTGQIPQEPGSVAKSLDARAAGTDFATLLDDEIAGAGIDFALARINAVHGTEVLHLALPDDARANVEVLFLTVDGAATGTSYPRIQVQAGRNSQLNLVERHLGGGDGVVNEAVDIAVGAGADVRHTRLQACADTATCFDTLAVHIGERAHYALRSVTLGALSSRTTAFIKLAGHDAQCDFIATSVANGIQTHDVFAEIEHAAPRTVTRQMFRGVATQRGRLGFNGKMIVRASAHDADIDQSLKSLLSGSGAEAAARPQLEIYTDQVRARHGATTGKLDEQMLFYLLSRGIDRADAQALLQWAFVEDVISRIEPAVLRRDIEGQMMSQLHTVSGLTGLLGTTS